MANCLWPYGLQPTNLLCPWNSPGKNTGAGCHFLLQGIFLTQGLNLPLFCLLQGQAGSLPLVPPQKHNCWWYSLMILCISVVIVVPSFSFLFLLIWAHFLFFLMSLAKDLSVLLYLLKEVAVSFIDFFPPVFLASFPVTCFCVFFFFFPLTNSKETMERKS